MAWDKFSTDATGDISGKFPNLSVASGVITSSKIVDGAITDADIAAANKDGTAATPSLRTLGTGATQAAAGNDSRLSDSRTPSGSAEGDLTGTYPNPTVASGAITSAKIADGTIATGDIADGAVTTAKILDGTIANVDVSASAAIALSKLATDPLARANHTGTQTLSTISDAGTAASKNIPASGNASTNQVVYGTDTRLSDSRAPTGSAGGDLSGTYPNPSIATSAVTPSKLYTGAVIQTASRTSAAYQAFTPGWSYTDQYCYITPNFVGSKIFMTFTVQVHAEAINYASDVGFGLSAYSSVGGFLDANASHTSFYWVSTPGGVIVTYTAYYTTTSASSQYFQLAINPYANNGTTRAILNRGYQGANVGRTTLMEIR